MVVLPILHFNDVYRVQPFKPMPSSSGTIDVTQFAAMIEDIREKWTQRPDGNREGLLLFSGDVFAPSTESSMTRGSHMVRNELLYITMICGELPSHQVPVLNAIAPDVSLTGALNTIITYTF